MVACGCGFHGENVFFPGKKFWNKFSEISANFRKLGNMLCTPTVPDDSMSLSPCGEGGWQPGVHLCRPHGLAAETDLFRFCLCMREKKCVRFS